jgi:uridine kinase
MMKHKTIDDIVLEVDGIRRAKGRVLVAVDGRGGAGKSTLARALVGRLSHSAHVEYDWFHLPKDQVSKERRFDHDRLIADVISPFRLGSGELTFRRYNWGYLAGIPDGFHETPISIPPVDILILEGCETLHPELLSHFDLRVWVDTAPSVALERGMRRDIEEYNLDPERVLAAWKEWSAWEDERLASDDRRGRATVFV